MSDLKPILAGAFAGGITFLALEFAVGGANASSSTGVAQDTALPRVASAAINEGDMDALEADNVELAMSVASLQAQVDRLRQEFASIESRRPVGLTPVALADSEMELASAKAVDLGTEGKELVLQVLEEQRLQEEADREAERYERTLDRAASTADRLAEELGLSGADRDTLATILTDEAELRMSVMEEMGEVDWADSEARDTMRDRMGEVRETTRSAIELRLGAGVSEAWMNQGGRGGFGGFGGGGFGGFGGGRGGRGGGF
ncbi:hypothetical protein [Engelhardtia mirabilis]|uniref:Uncharacterized protein n=1 Tax=Engelhardtia mirabilis TaxID=2528011 RepID=A0A518BPJ8_9BACT|nr:hypothetical protein Pla133_40150 [Planctomycetes bacterium Pla133]QDV03227.1 hypothetical protein Pla86_40140 [Planctomycetes bacterium Pla86]